MQGLADMFILMRCSFESEEAQALNRQVFETIYFGALTASCELAEEHGPYETYAGCPVSRGVLQYDMWGVTPTERWDWADLKAKIARCVGLAHSLATIDSDPPPPPGLECATAFSWLPCQPPPLHKSLETTSPLSPTPATSTVAVCCRESFRLVGLGLVVVSSQVGRVGVGCGQQSGW